MHRWAGEAGGTPGDVPLMRRVYFPRHQVSPTLCENQLPRSFD